MTSPRKPSSTHSLHDRRKRLGPHKNKNNNNNSCCGLSWWLLTVVFIGSIGLWKYQQQQQHPRQRWLFGGNSWFFQQEENDNTIVEDDKDYPDFFVDLWPDDRLVSFHNTLLNCIPEYEDDPKKCQVKLRKSKNDTATNNNDKLVQRIAVASPPGKLGEIFVEFVTRVVNLHKTRNPPEYEIELVPTTHVIPVSNNNEYSKIVRLATLPILLQATDLAMTAKAAILAEQKPQSTTTIIQPDISIHDLMDITRQLIHWQCHQSQLVLDPDHSTALLTITLDRMMAFPSITTRKLQKFLDLEPFEKPKDNRIGGTDHFSLVVMETVNAASSLVQDLSMNNNNLDAGKDDGSESSSSTSTNRRRQQQLNMEEMVNNVIDEELQASDRETGGACQSIHSFGTTSPITNRVAQWLS